MFRILFIIVLAQLVSGMPSQNVQVLSSGSVDSFYLDSGKPNQLINSKSNLRKFSLIQTSNTIGVQFIQSTSYTKPTVYLVN